MFESLFAEMKVLSGKMEAKCFLMFLTDLHHIFPLFSKNSTQSPVVPPIRCFITTVETASDEAKLHPSVIGSVNVTNLTRPMESSIP